MEQLRWRKICPHCQYNLFADDEGSDKETECELDNEVNSSEWCEDYKRREKR
jgi:hypothetical protein